MEHTVSWLIIQPQWANTGANLGGGCRGYAPPLQDKVFFFIFAFKICLHHQSDTPFLSGAPSPKKNPGSTPVIGANLILNWYEIAVLWKKTTDKKNCDWSELLNLADYGGQLTIVATSMTAMAFPLNYIYWIIHSNSIETSLQWAHVYIWTVCSALMWQL